MRKIPSLFVRDWDGDRTYVTREVDPACQWVIDGEGVATRKYDGTCVMFDGEHWWARREVKKGRETPAGFIGLEVDGVTFKTMGYEPVEQSSFAKYHAEAVASCGGVGRIGTYELCGPKVNGNPEDYDHHHLIYHGDADKLSDAPRDFDGLAAWLAAHPGEGIVWHHPDGRMAKIKRRDFRAPLEVIQICPECTVTEKYVCTHCRHECPDNDGWPCPTYQAIAAGLLGQDQQRGEERQ